MTTIKQLRTVPAQMRLISGMEADYVDVFSADVPNAGEAAPSEWAVAAIERAAGSGGRFLWRIVLGLRLGRSSPSIGGWTIGGSGEHWIRLEASSWFMTAHVLVYIFDEQLVVATFVRYDNPAGAFIWPAAAIVHRRAMPSLLQRTVRSIEKGVAAR